MLFIINNPFIERHTLAAQREVNSMLFTTGLDLEGYNITLDGVGSSCTSNRSVVNSAVVA